MGNRKSLQLIAEHPNTKQVKYYIKRYFGIDCDLNLKYCKDIYYDLFLMGDGFWGIDLKTIKIPNDPKPFPKKEISYIPIKENDIVLHLLNPIYAIFQSYNMGLKELFLKQNQIPKSFLDSSYMNQITGGVYRNELDAYMLWYDTFLKKSKHKSLYRGMFYNGVQFGFVFDNTDGAKLQKYFNSIKSVDGFDYIIGSAKRVAKVDGYYYMETLNKNTEIWKI